MYIYKIECWYQNEDKYDEGHNDEYVVSDTYYSNEEFTSICRNAIEELGEDKNTNYIDELSVAKYISYKYNEFKVLKSDQSFTFNYIDN